MPRKVASQAKTYWPKLSCTHYNPKREIAPSLHVQTRLLHALRSMSPASLSSFLRHRRYTLQLTTMSTLVDSIINSDAFAATPPSARQDRRPATNLPSSGLARGAPSESNGLPSDGDIFPDDEVVGVVSETNPNPLDRNVSKVVDRAGEKVQQA